MIDPGNPFTKTTMTTASKNRSVILVIDDDPDIVQTIQGNLELDGYDVLTAHDGRTGIDLADRHRPDMVLLDLNLPDIDGIKACQILRKGHAFPLIMLTARDSVADKVLGLECGADDYIVKPFDFLELSARIRVVLKRSRPRLAQYQIHNEHVTIDFKSRSVSIKGREIKLTKTEQELLKLLASYPDEALSREFIQKNIWRDAQLYQNSRTLDVHIQRLRKKIEPDPEDPRVIVTVTGVGYKLTNVT